MKHYPVMLRNVLKSISQLHISTKLRVADCNFGLGGHSTAILQNFPNASIKAYELDPYIIKQYSPEKPFGERLQIINSNYSTIESNPIDGFHVVLADLGFNSLQLDERDGFSWNRNSPLDMRYSPNSVPCGQRINTASYIEIYEFLVNFGDLKKEEAKLVAQKIIDTRPYKTTFELRDNIVGCFQKGKTRKIAQVFQAFRIVTNNEFGDLRVLCQKMDKVLVKNGLCLMITFHSLERNLITKIVREKGKIFSKIKTEKPSKEELAQNSRSRSAQMLMFRRVQ